MQSSYIRDLVSWGDSDRLLDVCRCRTQELQRQLWKVKTEQEKRDAEESRVKEQSEVVCMDSSSCKGNLIWVPLGRVKVLS